MNDVNISYKNGRLASTFFKANAKQLENQYVLKKREKSIQARS